MRGGLERWKRGLDSHGVRTAIGYAMDGSCDAPIRIASGVAALEGYSGTASRAVTRFTVVDGEITTDLLSREQLCAWVDGRDPLTGVQRGRALVSPRADLVLDGTINAPKSFSLVAMIHPELAAEFEALQDRLRDRVIRLWQAELNARRGVGGKYQEPIHQLEVVELQHRRSRALDPHVHRHLWLSVKVLGADGQWSNVDSRVAMRLHTVINAEGELATRTDPAWRAALARHGYTLNEDGEIAEVAHAVRALSRRSTQIERNRTVLLTLWRNAHLGLEPDPETMAGIDRHAWRMGRPGKPHELDEADWELLIRHELNTLDPRLLTPRAPSSPAASSRADIGLLAAKAIVEADARAAATGGRMSVWDVRAAAMRAVAGCGLIDERAVLQGLIDEVTDRALGMTIDLLDGERPAHVKARMAMDTVRLKIELATLFDHLTAMGSLYPADRVATVVATIGAPGGGLDERQGLAAAAIAGTDRLVTVTGPAGTGKTTMLQVAHRCLADQGGRMIVVASTRKAASIAQREIGAESSSLHALLADHGWRWSQDQAGAEVWTHLHPGQVDAATGMRYDGPVRYPLSAGDRIVVDEAGMVNLNTAYALAVVACEMGAGIAMVGDHLQAAPVGHAGAMEMMRARATATVELGAVHRFDDPDYAALTLRMREPASRDEALTIATDLEATGHIRRVDSLEQARDAMVDAYFSRTKPGRRVALVTGTNDEADAINNAIQQRRIDLGQLKVEHVAVGMGEQLILEGDVVQTRRNDHHTGVENRALWTVHRITNRTVELASHTDPTSIRVVTTNYVSEHVHLAYASTVHGIQGETTHAAMVGPGVDAAGLYVGMTRGRAHNEAIAIAHTTQDAREKIADTMQRGLPETSIEDSIHAAHNELHRAARDIDPDVGPPPSGEAQDDANLDRWIYETELLLAEAALAEATTAARFHARTNHTTTSDRGEERLQTELQALLTTRNTERDSTDRTWWGSERVAPRLEISLHAGPFSLLTREAEGPAPGLQL